VVDAAVDHCDGDVVAEDFAARPTCLLPAKISEVRS
jgi:hypothetical protein